MPVVFSGNLKSEVLSAADRSDEIFIISGYASPSTVEDLCNLNKPITFIYGMYKRGGISKLLYDKLLNLKVRFPDAEIKVADAHHVHTKCYVFKKGGIASDIFVGSANCSEDGLTSPDNCELLVKNTILLMFQKLVRTAMRLMEFLFRVMI